MGAARRSAAWATVPHEGRERRAIVTRTAEPEVIPRLLEAHPDATEIDQQIGRAAVGRFTLTAGHVAELVRVVLAAGEEATLEFVEAIHGSGAAPEAIYLDLLAPAARRLGQMWDDDTCDFTQVSSGYGGCRRWCGI